MWTTLLARAYLLFLLAVVLVTHGYGFLFLSPLAAALDGVARAAQLGETASPLHLAVAAGGDGLSTRLLLRLGAVPDAEDSAGRTVLHVAARAADAEAVDYLLRKAGDALAARRDAAGRLPEDDVGAVSHAALLTRKLLRTARLRSARDVSSSSDSSMRVARDVVRLPLAAPSADVAELVYAQRPFVLVVGAGGDGDDEPWTLEETVLDACDSRKPVAIGGYNATAGARHDMTLGRFGWLSADGPQETDASIDARMPPDAMANGVPHTDLCPYLDVSMLDRAAAAVGVDMLALLPSGADALASAGRTLTVQGVHSQPTTKGALRVPPLAQHELVTPMTGTPGEPSITVRLFSPADTALLGVRLERSTFDADAFALDAASFPAAAAAVVGHETALAPGDVLFVPSGWAYAAALPAGAATAARTLVLDDNAAAVVDELAHEAVAQAPAARAWAALRDYTSLNPRPTSGSAVRAVLRNSFARAEESYKAQFRSELENLRQAPGLEDAVRAHLINALRVLDQHGLGLDAHLGRMAQSPP